VSSMRVIVKAIAGAAAVALASPAGLACWIERRVAPDADGVFRLFAHTFALLPGLPGAYLRRGFYQLTLEHCSAACHIGFGSFFTHRRVVVEDHVYVGDYSLIASSVLRSGCLIGSQSSLLSGPALHAWDGEGWLPTDASKMRRIEIGARSWIGERAVVMADIGAGAMVAAGAVVGAAVPAHVMVAGNPARFVRRMTETPAMDTAPIAALATR
jgi:virginiamycin A acetyltransferase